MLYFRTKQSKQNILHKLSQNKHLHSVYPPNFQKGGGGLTEPQLLEGDCWERGVTFFRGGGLQFSHSQKN